MNILHDNERLHSRLVLPRVAYETQQVANYMQLYTSYIHRIHILMHQKCDVWVDKNSLSMHESKLKKTKTAELC